MRRRSLLVDASLAGALVAVALVESAFEAVSVPRWADAIAALGFTVPLAWRRRAPLTVLAVCVAAVLAYGQIELDGPHEVLIPALALASFTVGCELPLRRAWLGPALLVAGILIAAFALGQSTGDAGVAAILYVGPWVFGQAMRSRGERVDALLAHAERVEREREAREREAAAAERQRIARELHDVVSHSISVIAIQAQAVRRRLGPEHEREIADLQAVESTARQAMAEMRRLLGVLRVDGERLPLAPQPGLDQLPGLIERTREAGLRVDLAVTGTLTPLPAGIDLAAYRIVQEALTNVLKHAGAASVEVLVEHRERGLSLTVEDDGMGPSTNGNGNGHGLYGMRERVALYAGTIDVGAGAAGGFRVHVDLPVHEGGG